LQQNKNKVSVQGTAEKNFYRLQFSCVTWSCNGRVWF